MNKFWIAVVVIAVIAGGVWLSKNGDVDLLSYTPSSTPTPTESPAKTGGTSVVKKTATATATPAPTPAMSYTELVAQYGTNRIQFDANCQALPSSVVFKNGTKIMLDNRSNQARTISVNSTKYNLIPYGYQLVILSNSSLPQTISLSCDNQVNVGTIQLQANISGQ